MRIRVAVCEGREINWVVLNRSKIKKTFPQFATLYCLNWRFLCLRNNVSFSSLMLCFFILKYFGYLIKVYLNIFLQLFNVLGSSFQHK